MAERPTPTTRTDPHSFEGMLDTLDDLNAPDGFRAEIIGGNIVVSPWSQGYCLDVMDLVCEQLRPHLPDGHRISQAPALYVFPDAERAYGPSIHAVPERARRTTSTHLDGEALSFVAELTSPSTRSMDLTDKVEDYGRAGVPLYLVLDMQREEATIFWGPYAKGYEGRVTKPFGEKLPLPAPFDCVLDTTGFHAPQKLAPQEPEQS
jgi:Uma2 family endonuclease